MSLLQTANANERTGVCCSVLQCVAVSCSVLQCVAVCCHTNANERTEKEVQMREQGKEREREKDGDRDRERERDRESDRERAREKGKTREREQNRKKERESERYTRRKGKPEFVGRVSRGTPNRAFSCRANVAGLRDPCTCTNSPLSSVLQYVLQ